MTILCIKHFALLPVTSSGSMNILLVYSQRYKPCGLGWHAVQNVKEN